MPSSDHRNALRFLACLAGLVCFTCLTFLACPQAFADKGAGAKHKHASQAAASNGAEALLNMQAEAWNRGDLDTFLSGYVKGPEISYVSGSSEVWGYDALQARYKNKYGDNHDTMGTLKFSDLKIQDLGSHNALCIGHWHLDRADKAPVAGIFSLVLVRTSAGWKIMHDHTSVSEPTNIKS